MGDKKRREDRAKALGINLVPRRIKKMEVPKCGNCWFWAKVEGQALEGKSIGSCLRLPPQLLLIPQQTPMLDEKKILSGGPVQNQLQLLPMAYFPIIEEGRWCGEHKPKPI